MLIAEIMENAQVHNVEKGNNLYSMHLYIYFMCFSYPIPT